MAGQTSTQWPAPTISTTVVENLTAVTFLEMLDRAVADGDLIGIAVIRRGVIGSPADFARSIEVSRVQRLLTERQREIAVLAAEAQTNRQIARRLHVSEHTVNYHLRQIFRRLAVGSRVELGRLVNGLPPGPGGARTTS